MELALLLGGVAVLGVILWFSLVRRRVSRRRNDMETAARQLRLYSAPGPDELTEAQKALRRQQIEISQTIYRDAVAAYHRALLQRRNRVAAYLLGFCKTKDLSEGEEET